MAKLRSYIEWSYMSFACRIQNTLTHGVRFFPMSNIATIDPCVSQLAIDPFRWGWGWDSNHWGPWMLHYPWWPPRLTRPLSHQKLTKTPDSLRRYIKYTNRFRIFYIILMPSTSSAIINIGCNISFRREKKFGYTCKKNALQGPIGSFLHSIMVLTPSPRLWVEMILTSTFPLSMAYTQCLMCLSFGHISHHSWTPQRQQRSWNQ